MRRGTPIDLIPRPFGPARVTHACPLQDEAAPCLGCGCVVRGRQARCWACGAAICVGARRASPRPHPWCGGPPRRIDHIDGFVDRVHDSVCVARTSAWHMAGPLGRSGQARLIQTGRARPTPTGRSRPLPWLRRYGARTPTRALDAGRRTCVGARRASPGPRRTARVDHCDRFTVSTDASTRCTAPCAWSRHARGASPALWAGRVRHA